MMKFDYIIQFFLQEIFDTSLRILLVVRLLHQTNPELESRKIVPHSLKDLQAPRQKLMVSEQIHLPISTDLMWTEILPMLNRLLQLMEIY